MLLLLISYTIDSQIKNQLYRYYYADTQFNNHYIDIIIKQIEFKYKISGLKYKKTLFETENLYFINNDDISDTSF
jgi:hypothetical protein